MQKSKLNANPVGANCIRPHFKEMTLRKENGITLIALIITIIVMLILVGVTINVALNGGVFQKAEYASEQMQIKAEEEELLSAVVASIGNDGKIGNIVLPAGWSELEDGIYKSPKGNIFKVHPNGKIEYIGKYTGSGNGGNTPEAFAWASVNLGNVDTSAEYKGYFAALDMTGIISFTEDGRIIMNANGDTIEKDAKDEKNVDKETRNLSFSIELMEGIDSNIIITMNENKTDINFEIVGLETVQCVKQEKTIYTNEEVLKALGITNSVGTYNDTWVKIGEENGKVKLLSGRNVTKYTLGAEDSNAIGKNELQKAIWSYKNLENTLNNVAQEITGITSARSVKLKDIYDIIGEENIDKGTEYGTVYNYYYNTEKQTVYSKYKTGENTWSEPYNTGYSSQIFVNDNGEEVLVDSAGDEVTLTNNYYFYTLSDEQKKDLKDLNLRQTFFYADSIKLCSSSGVTYFTTLSDSSAGEALGGGNHIFKSTDMAHSETWGVRAVILVPGL